MVPAKLSKVWFRSPSLISSPTGSAGPLGSFIVNNSLKGSYNGSFAQFLLKNNYGYRDKQEVEQTNEIKVSITDDESKL